MRELGGLYVLGTERHESRRIDNQLRGRSGRQGDPGESRFYLSLEDELMRLFATGADERVMDTSFPDDMPLESKMVIEGDRARAGHGRGPQLRDPQGRAQVRRGDERAAQDHLPAPPADPRRRRPARRGGRGDRVRDQPPRRPVLRGRVRRGVGHRRAARRSLRRHFPTRITQGTARRRRSAREALERAAPRRRARAVRGEGRVDRQRRRCATSSAA